MVTYLPHDVQRKNAALLTLLDYALAHPYCTRWIGAIALLLERGGMHHG
jgi:hypothetical protein